MTPSVQRVVEFAKRVPGFCDFTQDDQLILIKLGFFEVWLNYIAKATTDLTLTFDDGTYLTRQQLEIMYDVSICSSLALFKHFQEQEIIVKMIRDEKQKSLTSGDFQTNFFLFYLLKAKMIIRFCSSHVLSCHQY